MMVDVPCPLCGAFEGRREYFLSSTWLECCAVCSLHYVNPRAPSEVLRRHVQHWAQEDVVDAERLRVAFSADSKALYRRLLGWLESYVSGDGRRLFDVGCGTGALLSVARERGWQVRGLEVGKESSQYARDCLGIDVAETSLYDADIEAESFDVVAMTEVIEHIEDPLDALRRVRRWLRPGGLLLLTTPNVQSLYKRLFGARWWVINCENEHIVLFDPHTLRLALRKCGFSVEREYIRGIDIIGMMREIKPQKSSCKECGGSTYYDARQYKEQVKKQLGKVGLDKCTKGLLSVLNSCFSHRLSPLYGFGEQLIFIARHDVDFSLQPDQ